jgi:hypothetical protein
MRTVTYLMAAVLLSEVAHRYRFEDAIQSITEADFPRPTRILAPLYPSRYSPRGGQANIRLNLVVPADGRNLRWAILRTSDYSSANTPSLLVEAERLLQQWRFSPGRTETLFRVTLSFRRPEQERMTRRICLIFAEPIVRGTGLRKEKRLLVRGRIRADGLVGNVRLEGASGLEPLVRAAVALWRYAPSSSETAFSVVVSIHNLADGTLR